MTLDTSIGLLGAWLFGPTHLRVTRLLHDKGWPVRSLRDLCDRQRRSERWTYLWRDE